MTNPDPVDVGQTDGSRVGADPVAAVTLARHLAEVTAGLAGVRGELSALLHDIDAAVGVGDSAHAFRMGFAPAAETIAESLQDAEDRLGGHRRALVAGVDALVDADAEASARLGRSTR